MAEFECKVYRLTIEEHPNADAIELAIVGDYRSIVKKGQFKTGDLGVYIPEAAVCPDWLIKELGLEGRLAGKQKNRVKAIKLRGVLSQGLVYPITGVGRTKSPTVKTVQFEDEEEIVGFLPVAEGDDVTEALGLVKYEPPIPVHMAGEVFNAHGHTLKYDIENFKKYPNVIQEGEQVVFTEKLHGTWCCFGYHPDIEHPIVTSKGLSAQGLAFKFNDANKDNLYIRTLNGTIDETGDDVITRHRRSDPSTVPFYILGEVYGKGVQDLQYGADKPQFRVFDVYVGEPGRGTYLRPSVLVNFCNRLNLEMVPVLYRGPFSKEAMLKHTDGATALGGEHIREGIVVTPFDERHDTELGRVKLKSISEKYLLRKGGTEFN